MPLCHLPLRHKEVATVTMAAHPAHRHGDPGGPFSESSGHRDSAHWPGVLRGPAGRTTRSTWAGKLLRLLLVWRSGRCRAGCRDSDSHGVTGTTDFSESLSALLTVPVTHVTKLDCNFN